MTIIQSITFSCEFVLIWSLRCRLPADLGEPPLSKLPVAAQAFLKLLLAGGALFGAMELFRLVLLPELQSALQLDATASSVVRRMGILLSVLLAYWA